MKGFLKWTQRIMGDMIQHLLYPNLLSNSYQINHDHIVIRVCGNPIVSWVDYELS